MIGNMLGIEDEAISPKKKNTQDSTGESSDFHVDRADIDEDKQNQSYVHEDEEN